MVNVRVGIEAGFGRSVWIENGTKLHGIYAPILDEYLYFITSKSNVSFVQYDKIKGFQCFTNGTCLGILHDLQRGLIDLTMTRFSYNLLNNIGTNLTTIVQEEDYCDAIYKQNVTEIHSSSAFFEFLSQFDFDVWLPFAILFTVFSLIFFITSIHQSKQSIFKVLWHHCEYLLYQNFESFENLHKKWLYIIYILTLLLVSKLLSSTLQTGLVIHKSYVKLESYRDIFESGYQFSLEFSSFCHGMIKSSSDPYAELINERYEAKYKQLFAYESDQEDQYSDEKQDYSDEQLDEIDEKERPNINNTMIPYKGLYFSYRDDNKVSLEIFKEFDLIKRAGCTFAIEQEMDAPLINKHIAKMFVGYLMSKRSLPSVQKLIFNGYYTLFETGGISSRIVPSSYLPSLGFSASPSCMETDQSQDDESQTVSLDFHFFRYPFIIFIIQITISIIIFLLQFTFYHR